MSKFIKLTSRIINSHHIKEIVQSPNKFNIRFANHKTGGFLIVGSGRADSLDDDFNICIKKNPQDYKIVSDWINKMNNNWLNK